MIRQIMKMFTENPTETMKRSPDAILKVCYDLMVTKNKNAQHDTFN